MSSYDIIRAWKDEDYLESLSEEQRSQLPENPAGIVEMSDEDMESVGGGSYYNCNNTNGCNVVSNDCGVTNDYAYCGSFFC